MSNGGQEIVSAKDVFDLPDPPKITLPEVQETSLRQRSVEVPIYKLGDVRLMTKQLKS